jgi:hypothetical protein
MNLEVFQGIAEEKYPQPSEHEIIMAVMNEEESLVSARRNKIKGFLDGVQHVMSTMSSDMSDYYNRVMKLKFNLNAESKDKEVLVEYLNNSRAAFTHWVCHKGCGFVKLEWHHGEITCGTCGEELADKMTNQFIKLAKQALTEV